MNDKRIQEMTATASLRATTLPASGSRTGEDAQDTCPEMATFGVFGVSPAMRPVLALIRQAATNGRAVLICGEAGTGRGRIARAIHALAHGRPDSFVAVDCAAGTVEALETNLFGTPRPSETSRTRTWRSNESVSPGSFLWRAFGGSLYLANVVDMPSLVQARLARLVRDGEAIGPGGSLVRLHCRFVAAVEPGFERAVAEGQLRRDLHHRLASLRIDVPPLRDRAEDIPALAEFFLAQCASCVGAEPKRVSPAAAALLQALPWRGNVWELRGLLETLAQWVLGDTIDLPDVLGCVRLDPQARSVAMGGTLRAARQRFEREYIHAVLQQTGWRVPAAARTLGIQRTNLYRKMRTLGLTHRLHAEPAGDTNHKTGLPVSKDRGVDKWQSK